MKKFYPSQWNRALVIQVIALALIVLCLLTAYSAKAQTAANWNFNGTLAGTPGSSITLTNPVFGSSIVSNTFNGSTEYYGQDGWPAGAIDPHAYLEFSVAGNTGYYLVLNTVTLVIRRSNTGSPAGAGPNSFSLRSSLDNYATDVYTGSMTYNYATYTISLPAAFQGIPSSVTFRVYGYNTTINSGGNSRFVYDNISVQGQANPGTLAEQSIDLTAKAGAGSVDLSWSQQGFDPGTRYTVERSVNGADFTAIGSAAAHFTDAAVPAAPRLFYRILAEPSDGSLFLSKTISVTPGDGSAATSIRGVSSPGGGSIRTFLHIAEAGVYQLCIWSQDGKAMYRQTINEQSGDFATDLAFGASVHGLYVLTLSRNGVNSSRPFVY
jgi:hypothetical protein